MSECLNPCSACGRHARASETACPFCGGELTRSTCAASTARPLTRAALVFASAAAAIACGKSPVIDHAPDATVTTSTAPDPTVMAVPAYGAPPVFPASDAGTATPPKRK